ncbi:MAG: peptidylprolyl isomerase [Candidatus Magnetomorum sp.]|nr:peptidylprolyl isomerase [Candidatus Magnetomorum sp.]
MSKDYSFIINNNSVELTTAFNCLRGLDDTVLHNLIQIIIGRQYAKEKGIKVSNEELQVAVDEFRYLQDMESSATFISYLKNRKISLLSFQNAMENILLINKLTDDISDEETDAYIAKNQLQFEQVELYNIRLDNEDTASEIKELLDDEEMSFPALAYEHSIDEDSKKRGGYIGFLSREEMTATVEAAVFKASEGDIIGPYKTQNGYNIFMINTFHKPKKDDPDLRLAIKQKLLQAKLQDLIKSADIKCPFYE